MLKRLSIGVAFLAVVACGGGGGGGDGGTGGTTGPTGNEPTGSQTIVLAPGYNKTIHASVGDTIELRYEEPSNRFNASTPTGETCQKTVTFANGAYIMTLGAFTKCVFEMGFTAGGTAHLEIVPL